MCTTTEITPVKLADMEVQAGTQSQVKQTFTGFSDKASDYFTNEENVCGKKTYTLVDSDLTDFISLKVNDDGDTITIIVTGEYLTEAETLLVSI